MSHKRYIDNEHQVSFYHVILKVPDNTDGNAAFAFKESHKQYFERLLFRLEEIYLIDLVSYCIMSTHVHLIFARTTKALDDFSSKEASLKYQSYYQLKEAPDARILEVRKFKERLNDLSEFMRDLQRRFTFWYNNQFTERRRGSLWNPRYKSIVLASGKALADCMKYVELNPVRAQMVRDPREYQYSSWYHICLGSSKGSYLRANIIQYLRYMYQTDREFNSDDEVFSLYANEFEALIDAVKTNKDIKSIDPYLVATFLRKSSMWDNSKVVGGDVELEGIAYGRTSRIILNISPL